ncbi:MAG TPA: hypothetical protein DCR04_12505 [Flavobacteriales bacterium]|nr:hypothetical protein [Flavobacteriales bacterium]
MNYDSLSQYYQALGILPVNDWHPLIMTRLWQACNFIYQGPHLMLALFMSVYWVGIGLFAKTIGKGLVQKTLALLFLGFFPTSFLVMSAVWKDAGMMAFMITSAALIYVATINTKKRNVILLSTGVLLGCIGAAFRHNAIFALLPLLGMIFFVKHFSPVIKAVFFSIAIMFAYGVPKVVNSIAVEEQNPHMENILLAWDLSGISVEKGKLEVPNYALHDSLTVNFELVRHHHDYRSCNGVIFGAKIFNPEIWTDESMGITFRKDALQIIRSNPTEYAKIRWAYTKGMLFGSRWWPNLAYFFEVGQFPGDENLGIEMYHMLNPRLLDKMERALAPVVHYKLFTAAPYLVLLLLVCFLNLKIIINQKKFPALVMFSVTMALSGLLYWIPYVILGPADDFRYSSWTVFCAVSSALLYLSWRWKNRSTEALKEEEIKG